MTQQFHTIFYQGILCSQTQLAKYIGGRTMRTSSGQIMTCTGLHDLKPINVLINPFIGTEIKDVNTHPFDRITAYVNPITLACTFVAKISNWYQGIQVYNPNDRAASKENLKTYGLKLSEISIGQETDIESHYEKYRLWRQAYPHHHLILWGVSRGAATTFNAMAKYQYPEVRLVVLEGCFYTVNDVLKNRYLAPISSLFKLVLNVFTRYHHDGPTPAKSVHHFPENVPVVFITSKKDHLVPASSTIKLAKTLAARQKNDIYLLELECANHVNYMFDNKTDHDNYEAFMHAIYHKYDMPYDEILAQKGRALLTKATIYLNNRA